MKKVLFILMGSVSSLFALAQNIQDVKQLITYERYKSAGTQLHQLLQAQPTNAEAWYWLSQVYLSQHKGNTLRDTLSFAPADTKNEPYYQVAYGHLLLAENKKDSATVYFQQALDKTKQKDADILAAIANAHISEKAGDAVYAAQLLDQATKKEKKDPYLYTLWGDAFRKQGNGSDAYKTYQLAIDHDGKYAPALYRLGKIFVAQKNAEMYLDYFNKALQADSNYTPALYELYFHYYFIDAQKAMDVFKSYMAKSDKDINNDYLYTDLLYLNKQYDAAIANTQQFPDAVKDSIPRLYKLMAYSYAGLKDTANALTWMSRYFGKEVDSNMVAKDYETMATLYDATPGKEDSAIVYYVKTVDKIKDSSTLFQYYKKLANLYNSRKDYAGQATWLGKFYTQNSQAGNVDLFNWGIANIKAENYEQADTVFGIYIEKYPEQSFGYYWRARANAAQDTTMEKGQAVPWYTKLIEVLEADTTGKANKKWEVEAYGYLAAYETNVEKDYKSAIDKLHRIQEIDPANKDAQQYINILEKKLVAQKDTGSNNKKQGSNAN